MIPKFVVFFRIKFRQFLYDHMIRKDIKIVWQKSLRPKCTKSCSKVKKFATKCCYVWGQSGFGFGQKYAKSCLKNEPSYLSFYSVMWKYVFLVTFWWKIFPELASYSGDSKNCKCCSFSRKSIQIFQKDEKKIFRNITVTDRHGKMYGRKRFKRPPFLNGYSCEKV